MPRTCTICKHPEREAIDRALIDGGAFRNIAQRFRVSATALFRHKADHLPATMLKAAEAEDVAHALDVVKQLKAINQAAQAILADARKAGDGELALKAIDRIQKQIELQAKLLGELSDAPQVNVTLSPEWLSVRQVLVTTLAPYLDARAALAGALVRLESGDGHRR